MRRVFIILLLFLSVSPVFSAEWIGIGTDLFLDKDSVRYIPKMRTYKAWIKMQTEKGTTLYFNEYNLKTREYRNLDKVLIDSSNNIMKREFNNHVGLNWLNIVPDTHSSLEFQALKNLVEPTDKLTD